MNKFLLITIILFAFLLRVVWLDRFPLGLYTDEADQAYNALSILKTSRDEHGAWLPVSFRSFGDWKPPLQTYLMIPFFAAGVPIEYSTRLPGAVFGTVTIGIFFLLLKRLGSRNRTALLAVFILSISPWHILQSRSAMLVAPSLFFLVTGVWAFFRSKERSLFLLLSGICFALAIYGYYGMRVVVPLMVLFLALWNWRRLWAGWRWTLGTIVLMLIVLLPLGISFLHQPDVVFGRAKTVSVFFDQGVRLRQWELITQDGIDANPHLTNFFHPSVYLFARNIAGRFLSHFDGLYLFFVGDTVQPFQIANMGIFYLVDSVFLVIGAVALWGLPVWLALLSWWLFITVLPAALTYLTPSSNRTFFSIIPMTVLIALGIDQARVWIRRPFLFATLSVMYTLSLAFFLFQYFFVMPAQHASWWNAGWKEVAQYISANEQRYQNVVVADNGGMPYIYVLLYGNVDPAYYQVKAQRTYVADRFGFEHVEGFGKYLFPQDVNWKEEKIQHLPHTLYVLPGNVAVGDEGFTHVFYYPNGTVMAKVFTYD